MKKPNTNRIRTVISLIAIIIIVVVLGVLFAYNSYVNGSFSLSKIAAGVFKSDVSIENAQDKLVDISISPYSFDYAKIYRKLSETNSQNNKGDLLGYGVYIKGTLKEPSTLIGALFGTTKNVKIVVFFDKDGNYRGVSLLFPRKTFSKEFKQMLSVANKKDLKYLALHVGMFYPTKDKQVLDLERKISNACMLAYSHIRGKDALFAIIPPPGKNYNEQLKDFLSSIKVEDINGHLVDFSKLGKGKSVIVTVNPRCGSCLDNFINFIILIPRNMRFDNFVVISTTKSKQIEDVCGKLQKNSHSRCNYIIDDEGELIGGNGKLSSGELIMLESGYKVYFRGPVEGLLKNKQLMNKIFRWQPYGEEGPTPGNGNGNIKP